MERVVQRDNLRARHSEHRPHSLGAQASQHAEASFRRAAECAEGQGSRPLHLRAVTSLARLWRDRHRSGEARDLVAPVYGSFTEGLDAPDLIEARTLLEELA